MDDYKVYTCTNCGDRYKAPLQRNVICAVNHGPGDCCHYNETKVTGSVEQTEHRRNAESVENYPGSPEEEE